MTILTKSPTSPRRQHKCPNSSDSHLKRSVWSGGNIQKFNQPLSRMTKLKLGLEIKALLQSMLVKEVCVGLGGGQQRECLSAGGAKSLMDACGGLEN